MNLFYQKQLQLFRTLIAVVTIAVLALVARDAFGQTNFGAIPRSYPTFSNADPLGFQALSNAVATAVAATNSTAYILSQFPGLTNYIDAATNAATAAAIIRENAISNAFVQADTAYAATYSTSVQALSNDVAVATFAAAAATNLANQYAAESVVRDNNLYTDITNAVAAEAYTRSAADVALVQADANALAASLARETVISNAFVAADSAITATISAKANTSYVDSQDSLDRAYAWALFETITGTNNASFLRFLDRTEPSTRWLEYSNGTLYVTEYIPAFTNYQWYASNTVNLVISTDGEYYDGVCPPIPTSPTTIFPIGTVHTLAGATGATLTTPGGSGGVYAGEQQYAELYPSYAALSVVYNMLGQCTVAFQAHNGGAYYYSWPGLEYPSINLTDRQTPAFFATYGTPAAGFKDGTITTNRFVFTGFYGDNIRTNTGQAAVVPFTVGEPGGAVYVFRTDTVVPAYTNRTALLAFTNGIWQAIAANAAAISTNTADIATKVGTNHTGNVYIDGNVSVDGELTTDSLRSFSYPTGLGLFTTRGWIYFDGTISADFDAGTLWDDNEYITVQWKSRSLLALDGGNQTMSLDWQYRDLYADDGTTINLDYSTPGTVGVLNLTADTISARTNYTVTGSEPVGTVYWNDATHGYCIVYPNGQILNLGDENCLLVQNNTGHTLTNGTVVMYAGSIGNSGNVRVTEAYVTKDTDVHMIYGPLTTDVPNGEVGRVTWAGKIKEIKLDSAAVGESNWTNTVELYVTTNPAYAGRYTSVKPQAPIPAVRIGKITADNPNNGTIDVHVERQCRVTDLADVNGTPLDTTGQIMVWDQTRGVFDFNYNYVLGTNALWQGLAGKVGTNDTRYLNAVTNNQDSVTFGSITASTDLAVGTTAAADRKVNVLTSLEGGFAGYFINDNATAGTGIRAGGTTYGVYGETFAGYGVYGSSSSGGGVWGSSSSGNGVYGESSSGYGVYGNSSFSYGVFGNSSYNYGVYGVSSYSYGVSGSSSDSHGVYGNSYSGSGVYGYSSTSYGVYGDAYSSHGVYGNSYSGYGVYGNSLSGYGVYGYSSSSHGSKFEAGGDANQYAVYADGQSAANGVYGKSVSGYAVYGDGNAFFTGDVTASNLVVSGTNVMTELATKAPDADLHEARGAFNGLSVKDPVLSLAVDANGPYATVTASEGGALQYYFSGDTVNYPATNTVRLTAGTTNTPSLNYICARPDGTLTNYTSYPYLTSGTSADARAIMFEVFLMDTNSIALGTGYALRSWTDNFANRRGLGRTSWIGERVRRLPALWESGVQVSLASTNSSVTDNYIMTTSGVGWQMHSHTIPENSTRTTMWMLNSQQGFKAITNLNDFSMLPDGSTMFPAVNDCHAINVFAFVESGITPKSCRLMIQLSTASYTTGTAPAKLANCIADASSYDVTGVPVWMQGMTIRIARIVIRRDAGGRTYWVYDRRGQPLGTSGGGSSSSGESDPVWNAEKADYATTASLTGYVQTNDSRVVNAVTNGQTGVTLGFLPYSPFSGTITPANGTATVTYAVGNMPSLTLTAPAVLTLDPTSYGTSGVSRVSLSLYCGTNTVTLATNVITYATTPTLSTNTWNTILIRRVSNDSWKGVQL